jgi:hypothetical protein
MKEEKENKKRTKYEDSEGFVFQGTPDEKIDVEKEVEKETSGSMYDPYKLATVLMNIGEKMLGVKLYEYQKEPTFRILYSMLEMDGAEITILYPRQSGKSEVVSFTVNIIGILFPVLAKVFPKQLGHFAAGVKMGAIAPQLDQVETVYERCMARLLSPTTQMFLNDPDVADKPLSTVNYKLKSGSFLKGQSGAKQSKIESKTYHIVFIDESQDMDTDKVRRSIIPMTASTFGTIIRTGTPGRYKGDFYYTIQNNRKHDRKLKSKRAKETKRLHFEYDYLHVFKDKDRQYKLDGVKFHTLYRKSVERDIKSMGANSEAFRMAYKVEWLLDVGMFVTEERMESNLYNNRIGFPKLNPKEDFVVAGLDIASARNETVLTFGKVDEPALDFGEKPRKTVCGWVTLAHTNYEEQFHMIAEALMENGVRVLYADYTGVGRALTDVLMYHLQDYIDIVPYTFSPSSKSDMWKMLDEDITNNKVIIPAIQSIRDTENFRKFDEQMSNLQKYWKGSFMVCEKGQGFSDDFCDSLALFNLAGNHLYTPPSHVEVSQNVLLNIHRNHNRMKDSRWL